MTPGDRVRHVALVEHDPRREVRVRARAGGRSPAGPRPPTRAGRARTASDPSAEHEARPPAHPSSSSAPPCATRSSTRIFASASSTMTGTATPATTICDSATSGAPKARKRTTERQPERAGDDGLAQRVAGEDDGRPGHGDREQAHGLQRGHRRARRCRWMRPRRRVAEHRPRDGEERRGEQRLEADQRRALGDDDGERTTHTDAEQPRRRRSAGGRGRRASARRRAPRRPRSRPRRRPARSTTTSRTVTPPGRPRRTAGTRSPRRTTRRRARARGRRTADGPCPAAISSSAEHRVDARRLERDDALRRGQPHADDRERHERRDEHRRRPQPAVHGSGSGLARAAGSSVGTSSWTSSDATLGVDVDHERVRTRASRAAWVNTRCAASSGSSPDGGVRDLDERAVLVAPPDPAPPQRDGERAEVGDRAPQRRRPRAAPTRPAGAAAPAAGRGRPPRRSPRSPRRPRRRRAPARRPCRRAPATARRAAPTRSARRAPRRGGGDGRATTAWRPCARWPTPPRAGAMRRTAQRRTAAFRVRRARAPGSARPRAVPTARPARSP